VGLIPGARWDTKRWPPVFFADLARSISGLRPEISFAIFGAPSDIALAKKIVELAGPEARIFDMTGRTSVGELVEALRLCSVVVSNDSGPMHIAASAGTPLVVLFGPTDPSLTGPRSAVERTRVLRPELDCIGCMKRYCDKGLCHAATDPAGAAKAAIDLLRWRN
jgi:heptosyltransferase-1/heptosyltransferase-2